MIIPVKKVLIYGMRKELDLFFRKAQEFGCLEFIKSSLKKTSDAPPEIKELIAAIKILRHIPKSSMPPEEGFASLQEAARRVVFLHDEIEHLLEEDRILRAEIARVSPFGHFSWTEFVDVQKMTNRFIQFFEIPSARRVDKVIPRELIYIGTEYDLDYFVSISKEKKKFHHITEVVIGKSLGVLEEEKQQVLWKISHFSQELESISFYFNHFQRILTEKFNEFHLRDAKAAVCNSLEEHFFTVEAWLPENKRNELLGLMDTFAVNFEEISIGKDERIPTYLENKKAGALGEDLVTMYDIPAINDHDPSPWVFSFFVLFFAMIISDAAYGLIYLGIALFLRKKSASKGGFLKRFNQMLFILSFACIIWGVMVGSFLGIGVPPTAKASHYLILDQVAVQKADYHMRVKDDVYQYWTEKIPEAKEASSGRDFLIRAAEKNPDGVLEYSAFDTFKKNILMEFSILVGILHIMISILRYLSQRWSGLGWLFFMIGSYLYFPSILEGTSLVVFLGWISKDFAYQIGPFLIYAGVSLAVILALIEHKWGGLEEVTKSVQILSDTLSYLRLYAFGLASSLLAATFNMLGADLPLWIGWAVILAGHLINFNLGLMAGVLHGLRLNFIESYHYSFNGDGRLFRPLKMFK
jgi:V/A-type H+/Na+-transporting ATPase subunit I